MKTIDEIEEKLKNKIKFEIVFHENYNDYNKFYTFKKDDVILCDTISWIKKELKNNNKWAWCDIEVKSIYKNIIISNFLHNASFKNKKDFEKSEECISMKNYCFYEIIFIIKEILNDLK